MSDLAIRAENLSKQYRIAARRRRHDTLRDQIMHGLRSVFTWNGQAGPKEETFWALKDVSFEVKQGEVVGIIGRNGAGKSTLLKILSRITEPTEGWAEIYGRVGSLLEVGVGFDRELSGGENIYLNGAILGMRKVEIARKFDEIVAFAEVERFIDTPVKRYSSGMYVRLAFAVAAHLEPEILIVDEVLAVGDAPFQKKCLGKMGDVAKQGRTVLFVSHNMAAVSALCSRCILLKQGRSEADGPTRSVIETYVDFGLATHGQVLWSDPHTAPGNAVIRLRGVRVTSEGKITSDVDIQKDVSIEIEFWNFREDAMVNSSIHLLDHMGYGVLASANLRSAALSDDGWGGRPHPAGLYTTRCTIPGNLLNEGTYKINAIVLTDVTNVQARVDDVLSFTVHDTGAMRKEYIGSWLGVVRPRLAWTTTQIPDATECASSEGRRQ